MRPARFGTVIFDCDSTLSAVEGIDELAGVHREAIAELTDAAMRGEVKLEEVYGRRLEIVRPSRAQLDALGRLYVERMLPDARATVAALRAEGIGVRIVSGGLRPAVLAVARALGVPDDDVAAVDVRFDEHGAYAGWDEASPLAYSLGKRTQLERWNGSMARPVMIVGDGITDLEARPPADAFVAFAGVIARDRAVSAADAVIRDRSLAGVLAIALGSTPPRSVQGRALLDRVAPAAPARADSSPRAAPADSTRNPQPDIPPVSFTGRFFLPGPTEVHPDVLAAQTRPMIGHRGKAMEELLATMQPGLRALFRTERPVYIASASATGLMEGAVRNGARRRVLSLVNGAFSERFFQIARACGLEAHKIEVALGAAHTPEMLADALRENDYDAVTVVHSETSTGALNPIADLARVTHEAGDVVLLVDSVTGLAGAPVETDAWQLDFVLTGSQKALALPPGLALGVANPRVLERAKDNPGRGVYFDFVEFEKGFAKNQTPNTPAISLLYALAVQVERIGREGVEARWARHAAMARRTWEWVDEMSARGIPMSVLAPEGARSPTVTCITLPPGRTGPEITAAVKARGFTIGSGYGSLKDATIRIGHMGDHTVDGLDALLAELQEVLAR